MTIKIFKSSDANAPVLNNTAGSVLRVVHTCLTAGFGENAGAGWLCDFSDDARAVFKAPTGLQTSLYLDDSSATQTRVCAYKTMNGLDVGSGRFPRDTAENIIIKKPANVNACAWILFVGESYLHLVVFYDAIYTQLPTVTTEFRSTTYVKASILSFGDLDSTPVGTPPAAFIAGDTSFETTDAPFLCKSLENLPTEAGIRGLFLSETCLQNVDDFEPIGVKSINGQSNVFYGTLGTSLYRNLTVDNGYPQSKTLKTSPICVEEVLSTTTNTRSTIYRGDIPGVLAPLFYIKAAFPFYENLIIKGPIQPATKAYQCVPLFKPTYTVSQWSALFFEAQ